MTVLLGVTKLSGLALASALPIWMTNEARLPVAFAPVVVLMEAVIVVVFQVKLAPLSNGFMRSRFALVSGSLGVLAAFSMMATGGVLGGMAGALLFITGGIVYGFAAVLTVGAQWGISYALRPRKAQGEYQGMDSTVQGAVAVIGPAIVLFLTGAADGGWFWLGGIVVLASIVVLLASGPLRARAIRLGKLDPDAA